MSSNQKALGVEPRINRKTNISQVWLIPLAAFVLLVGLAYQQWGSGGTRIEIHFDQVSGVTPNKTNIRYRDVDIGLVTHLRFDDNLKSVKVSAEINKTIAPYLSENSNFWIVSPNISLDGISGLSTVLSGVYIELDPGKKGEARTEFVGLEEPPVIRSYDVGTVFTLEAETLLSLRVGSTVYFRKIAVGEVVGYQLDAQNENLQITIFIESPYDQLVYTDSNFWNTSGIEFDVTAKGLSVQVESLSSMMWGSLSFDTPQFPEYSTLATTNAAFELHENRRSVDESAFNIKYPYSLRFKDSIRGLEVGAAVELKGKRIGEVTQIELLHEDSSSDNVNVTIAIHPQRFDAKNIPSVEQLNSMLNRLIVDQGMRAQLSVDSFITGALYVELALNSSEEKAQLFDANGISQIPTTQSQLSEISRVASNVMRRVDQLPLTQIGDDIAALSQSVKNIVAELDAQSFGDETGELAKNLSQSSKQLETLLVSAQKSFAQAEQTLAIFEPDTLLYETFVEMLRDVSEASEALEETSDSFSRNPQSLIYGNKNPEE